jgi:ubiquinone biosynthesis protein
LLLQKTMVMVEGVATSLDPGINMWETSGPFVKEWMRTELGPEAALADGLRDRMKTLGLIPDLIKRLDESLPRKGGAPPAPPLPDIPLMWEKRTGSGWWKYALTAVIAAGAGAVGMLWFG